MSENENCFSVLLTHDHVLWTILDARTVIRAECLPELPMILKQRDSCAGRQKWLAQIH